MLRQELVRSVRSLMVFPIDCGRIAPLCRAVLLAFTVVPSACMIDADTHDIYANKKSNCLQAALAYQYIKRILKDLIAVYQGLCKTVFCKWRDQKCEPDHRDAAKQGDDDRFFPDTTVLHDDLFLGLLSSAP